ncbi:MAG: EAL domain-containing protein [Pseudomonadales bacterium]
MNAIIEKAGTENQHARILITDDDPRMLQSLKTLLEMYDYQVDTASGGQSAISMVSSTAYDVLLLDLKMPEVTGHDVMRYITSNDINTLVIVVSGETSMDDIGQALRQGAYDYLQKPYVPEQLMATVKNAVRKKRLENSNKLMQARLDRSERLHRFVVNNSPDIVFMLNHKGHFSFLNSKAESLLGYPKGALVGRPLSALVDTSDKSKVEHLFERALTGGKKSYSIDVPIRTHNSTYGKNHFKISLWGIDDGEESEDLGSGLRYTVYGTARDISEKIEAEAFINFQAYHDLLTQLPNRALFKDRLEMAITHAQRTNTQLAVMFIDLDRFKVINDSLGHSMGDQLLKAVSARLRRCIRKGDTLSRFGGDEFTLLIPDADSKEAAIEVVEKILCRIKEPFKLSGHEIYVGASIGIALYPDSGSSQDTLIKNADIAMYRIKKTGKDGYHIFDHTIDTSNSERLMLEQDLRHAIENGEFEICYQPQINTDKTSICGVEALIRWNHPSLGLLAPADFIGIAEDSRLIVEIDKHTLRKACREIKAIHTNGLPGLRLAVNLSPLVLEREDFVENILTTLEEEDFPADLLEIEITENVLMSDHDDMVEKLVRLAGAGVKFAIDDFGTGYSSLSYLQKFPISTLKIDRSFINTIRNRTDDACIVNAIVAMAQGLKMSIVAEGVENKTQLGYLRALGCNVVQGYLFGRATRLDIVAQQFKQQPTLSTESSLH